jgi:hypothetical protein
MVKKTKVRALQGLVVVAVTAGLVVGTTYLLQESDRPEQQPVPEATPAKPDQDGARVRQNLLTSSSQKLNLTPVRGVWGVLMERGYAKGIATVVALTDGTANMYISTGGSVSGGRAYAPARTAAQALCQQAAESLAELQPTKDFPAPAKGAVRFYVLTDGGVRTVEHDLLNAHRDAGEDKLAPLFAAGDALLDALKAATSKGYIR